MEEAFPGDIIGLVNPGEFRLGDTICEGQPVNFEPLPQFSPEHYAILRCRDTDRRKQFQRGLEWGIQHFRPRVLYRLSYGSGVRGSGTDDVTVPGPSTVTRTRWAMAKSATSESGGPLRVVRS